MLSVVELWCVLFFASIYKGVERERFVCFFTEFSLYLPQREVLSIIEVS